MKQNRINKTKRTKKIKRTKKTKKTKTKKTKRAKRTKKRAGILGWGENIGKGVAGNMRGRAEREELGRVDNFIINRTITLLEDKKIQEKLDILLERRLDALLEKLSLGFKEQMTKEPKRKEWGKMRRNTHTYKAQIAREKQKEKLEKEVLMEDSIE